jgi:hypothetical protein
MMVYKSPLRHDTYKVMIYLIGNKPPAKPPAARRYSLKSMFQAVTAFSERKTRRGSFIQDPCTLRIFHFSTSNNAVVNWALTTAAPAFPLQHFFGIISYAGYTGETHSHDVGLSQRIGNIRTRDPRTGKPRDIGDDAVLEARDEVVAPGEMPAARSLSPYSHAVTAVQGSAYVISYYL